MVSGKHVDASSFAVFQGRVTAKPTSHFCLELHQIKSFPRILNCVAFHALFQNSAPMTCFGSWLRIMTETDSFPHKNEPMQHWGVVAFADQNVPEKT
jgi:hypothetical protein